MLKSTRLLLNPLEEGNCASVRELASDRRIYDMTPLIPHPGELR